VHCIHRFNSRQEPDSILTLPDIERGIAAVAFYLGQAVDALQLVVDEEHKPKEDMNPPRVAVMGAILALEHEIENGMLTSRQVVNHFNADKEPQYHVSVDSVGRCMAALGLLNRRTSALKGFAIRPEDIEKFKSMLNPTGIRGTSGTKQSIKPTGASATCKTQEAQEAPRPINSASCHAEEAQPKNIAGTSDSATCASSDAPFALRRVDVEVI
jgi:hypothetical protein